MTGLRIATFNLENLDDRPDQARPFAERLSVLRPQLIRLAADILCLQEVNAQPCAPHRPRRLAALDRLLVDTPYAGYQRATTALTGREGPADRHNLVVLSRFPILASRQIHHELVPPLTYRFSTALPKTETPIAVMWDRPILQVTVELRNGRRLHIVNVHLKAPLAAAVPGQKVSADLWRSLGGWAEGFFLAAVKRAGQALEARLVIERLFDAEPAALIAACGDFNADCREMPVRIVLGGEVDEAGKEHAERVMIALEDALPPARRYSVIHAGRPVMLDHLLASRTLAGWPHQAEIHNEALRDEALDPASAHPSAGSYHAPVVAEFAIEDGVALRASPKACSNMRL